MVKRRRLSPSETASPRVEPAYPPVGDQQPHALAYPERVWCAEARLPGHIVLAALGNARPDRLGNGQRPPKAIPYMEEGCLELTVGIGRQVDDRRAVGKG